MGAIADKQGSWEVEWDAAWDETFGDGRTSGTRQVARDQTAVAEAEAAEPAPLSGDPAEPEEEVPPSQRETVRPTDEEYREMCEPRETRETRETPTVRLPAMRVVMPSSEPRLPVRPANVLEVVEAPPEPSEAECLERLGSLGRAPYAKVSPSVLRGLGLDHRAGFLLSRVDGVTGIEALLDVCGMPAADAIRILYDLLRKNVIGTR